MTCYESDASSIPLSFIPLMVGDVTLILFHDRVDTWCCFNLAEGFICEDTMENIVRRAAAVIASGRFLVHLEMFLMNGWIRPLQRIDFFHLLVLIVEDGHFWSECCLNGLHPMGMDDARCDFVLCGSGVNISEFEDF